MEQLSSHSEDASQPSKEGGWSDFPPFVGDSPEQPRRSTEMKDLEEIHDCELDIIAKNSDVLGYNIDSKLIIWPERHKQAAGIKEKCIPRTRKRLHQPFVARRTDCKTRKPRTSKSRKQSVILSA